MVCLGDVSFVVHEGPMSKTNYQTFSMECRAWSRKKKYMENAAGS